MRKFFALIILLLSLVSCSQARVDPLEFQSKPFAARGCFRIDGEELWAYVEVVPGEGGLARLTLDYEPLCGVSFELSRDNAFICCDGLSIPTSNERVSGICELLSLFFLDPDDFYTTLDTEEGMVYRYTNEEGRREYELLLVDSLPKRITFSCDRREIIAEINEFLPG